jgi:hypothetical protein
MDHSGSAELLPIPLFPLLPYSPKSLTPYRLRNQNTNGIDTRYIVMP